LVTVQLSPSGREAISSVAFETSMPMKWSMGGSVQGTIAVAQPCVMRGPAPGNCSGSRRSTTGGTQANVRARGPEADRVTTLARIYGSA
jgi:hypothetical protein